MKSNQRGNNNIVTLTLIINIVTGIIRHYFLIEKTKLSQC